MSNNQPLVSILMNCYNGERYLQEAIDSIYYQTYSNWEIIFIDNCSTDSSAKIAKSYDQGRLKYYKTEKNISLGAARNWGMKFINGNFLAFLDTDDVWFSNKLEKQLNVIGEDIAFVYGPVIHINEKGDALRETKINKEKNFKSLLERYDINMHSTLINLKIVNVKFNEELSYCPDFDLFMKIVSENNNFVSINSSLAKYRIHSNSMSRKTINIQMNEVSLVLNKLKKNTFLYNKYKKSFDICIYKFDCLIKVKKMIALKSFYSASKELYLLSKVSKKYLILSILLVIPVLNKILYNKILYKYI
jgi:glycosyltransferase involved in cell wall biosynthesis